MIKYLVHNNIDFAKYDQCIYESKNSLIYGYSWYLNCVAPGWDILILNNYEAVMPLPKRKKYGINYIFQPAWVQQLGIFSRHQLKEDLIAEFINSIPRKFKLVDILFNFDNHFSSKYLSKKDNFILNLSDSYESLFEGYNKLRKRSVKKAKKLNLIIKEVDNSKPIINLFKKNKGIELNNINSDYELLNQLIQEGFKRQKVEVFCVKNKNQNLLGGVIFLKNKNRIIYLFSAVNQEGKESQVITFIIDFVIKKYSNADMILDFEGSMITSVAKFFESFGAVKETYFWYKRKRIIRLPESL